MTPESKVKKEIVAYLDSVDGLYHFPVTNSGYGRKGVPDRVCCFRGLFFALEIKAPGGTATPWQKRELAAIVDAGGIAEVVYAVEDVWAILTRLRFNHWSSL